MLTTFNPLNLLFHHIVALIVNCTPNFSSPSCPSLSSLDPVVNLLPSNSSNPFSLPLPILNPEPLNNPFSLNCQVLMWASLILSQICHFQFSLIARSCMNASMGCQSCEQLHIVHSRGGAAGLYLMVTNTSPEESSREAANGTIKLITCGTVFLDVFHKTHCFHSQNFLCHHIGTWQLSFLNPF